MKKEDNLIKKIEYSSLSQIEKNHLEQSIIRAKDIGVPVILDTYQLSNVLGIKWEELKKIINESQKLYYDFYISKKRGGKRQISMPNKKLKETQKLIKEKILENIKISDDANGFTRNKSIITNAKVHLNQEKILNIDLKDFFSSIHNNRVYYIFRKICGYNKDVSYCLMKLVTYKNALPQGAPTSPILSNIVSFMMDIRLKKLSEKMNIRYTRYADDITFSGEKNVINKKLLKCVVSIIEDCGFNVNIDKTRFQSKGRRQEVTGLIVNNNTLNVPKKYIKEIRQEIYYINKYGIKSHREKVGFKNMYYKDHLLGKILFVKSINNRKGEYLLKCYNEICW